MPCMHSSQMDKMTDLEYATDEVLKLSMVLSTQITAKYNMGYRNVLHNLHHSMQIWLVGCLTAREHRKINLC